MDSEPNGSRLGRTTVSRQGPSPYHRPEGGLSSLWQRLYRGLAHRHLVSDLRELTVTSGRRFCIVDVGCGPGYLVDSLDSGGVPAFIVGVDYDDRLLREVDRRPGRAVVRATAEDLPLDTNSVDACTVLHVVEHLYHPDALVGELARIVVSGGSVFCATPNPRSIAARLLGSRWSGWRDDHVSVRPPEYWIRLFDRYGFDCAEWGTTGLRGLAPFRFPPLCVFDWLALARRGMINWRFGEAFKARFVCR